MVFSCYDDCWLDSLDSLEKDYLALLSILREDHCYTSITQHEIFRKYFITSPMKRSQTLPENNTEHEHPNQRFGTLRSQSQEDFDSRRAGARLRKNAVEREVSGDKEQISR